MLKLHEVEMILATLTSGQRYIYHEGHLPWDRINSIIVDRTASFALEAEKRGAVYLVQRRIGPMPKQKFWSHDSWFQYIAVGR